MNDLRINKHQQSLVDYYLPPNAKLEELARIYSIFSDSTRLKILFALSICPMCVGDLAAMTRINRTTVSHQLSTIKREGLIKCKPIGKATMYYVSSKTVEEILTAGTNSFKK